MTQNEYKHISIEEDEEEEVFVVGAAAAPEKQTVPASVQQAAQATPTPSKTNSAEQTLDDLDAEPMSLLQKIIIDRKSVV